MPEIGDSVQITISEACHERLSKLRELSGNELTLDEVIMALIDYRRF